MKNRFSKLIIYVLTAVSFLLLNSCAGVQLKAIPAPPPTAKLRVYVQPISAPFPFPGGAGAWNSSHKGFAIGQIRSIERFLNQTGIYEVVPEQDVKEVLGGENPSYMEMAKNNWLLTRDIGKALYAEYVFVIERRAEPNKMKCVDLNFAINLINTSSGKLYEASTRLDTFDRNSKESMSPIIKGLYHTVFLGAKKDMFGTAIRKSEKMYTQSVEIATAPETKPKVPPQVPVKPIISPEPKPIPTAPKTESPVTVPMPKTKPPTPPKIPEKLVIHPEPKLITAAPKPEPKITAPAPVKPRHEDISGMDRLVIYDLEAPEQYRTVALIVTEVLREELFLLNRFILINRENLLDVLREMALQQSGLIDEKQAVKAGKGLAANQIVTGSLGILGKTYLLNAKRIDVETFATLGLASTRFVKGEEEDVLGRLPGLAKSLAGMQ
ncbi:MAG: CsgG/HfaB family protein [Desulfobacterales bacterium]|nr:CsgG/HfaB family protein [Desulfobacterales bacterium]